MHILHFYRYACMYAEEGRERKVKAQQKVVKIKYRIHTFLCEYESGNYRIIHSHSFTTHSQFIVIIIIITIIIMVMVSSLGLCHRSGQLHCCVITSIRSCTVLITSYHCLWQTCPMRPMCSSRSVK